ncbi:hypothetical protein D3C71_1630970 [compost metagenome]
MVQPPGQQRVFDIVNALRHAAYDVHQARGLGAHQFGQQCHAGAGCVACAHCRAQRVNRPQRAGAPRHHQVGRYAGPQGGDVRRLEGKVEMRVVQHGDQRVIVTLNAGRDRAVLQCVKKRLGQIGMPLHPAHGLRVAQVEVQP